MRSVTMKILLALVLQTCAKEMPVDTSADILVDKLLDRIQTSQNSDLDDTTLGKPGRLANPLQSHANLQTRPVIPTRPGITSNSAFQSVSPVRPAAILSPARPIFHSMQISKSPDVLARAEADKAEPFRLHTIKPMPGSRKRKRRIARGYGGVAGGSAGRGRRGQKSRSGHKIRIGFEAQTGLKKRIPKLGGMMNKPGGLLKRPQVEVINIGDVQGHIDSGRIDASKPISTPLLKELIKVRRDPDKKKGISVKLLGDGELRSPITIEVQFASESAKQAVESAGGTLNINEEAKFAMPAFSR